MRAVRYIPAAMLVATLIASGAFAQDDAEAFQKITLKQIMGPAWAEFERAFAALSADPRNDHAFQEMSVIVGEAGALNKVAPYLETLVASRPDDLTLRTILGRVYKDLLRDPVRARTHLDAVLAKDPEDFFAHYQLAGLFSRQSDAGFADAVKHYREAAAKVTRQHADLRTRILKELGGLLWSRRDANPDYAQEAFAAWDAMAAGARRFDLQTYEELADEYRARSLWDKEREACERYFAVLREIDDVPDSVTRCRLRTRIAEAGENLEQYAQAVEAYNEAIALLEENTWQRRKLESRVRGCYEKMRRLADREAELRKAVADRPDSIAARQSLARLLEASGRLAEAAQVLEQARELAPRNVPVLNALEAIYRRSGRDDALAGVLRARIALSSEDFNAYVDLADVHVRNGRASEAEKALDELDNSPSVLSEKFLLLARAYARYGLAKRAFVLYKRLVDDAEATAEQRFEFCDFCLAREEFVDEATAQAARLCNEGALESGGYARLAEVFRRHGKNDTALTILIRGIEATAKRPDGTEDRDAVFTLNAALSDLEHRMGEGHHAQAIGATLKALLAAPNLHFKRVLNDRLVTLLMNYGHRQKLLYSSEEERADARVLGGPRGEGIAPWVDFLNVQANSREDADLWMLLGQIHETVEVDAELPRRPDAESTEPRRIKTDIAQARLCYQKVIDMEFQNLDAHKALMRVLADPAVDEYEKAVNELEVLALLNPVTKWESFQQIGDLYADAGETALAHERWRAVAEQSAGEPNLLSQTSMRMYRAGDLDRALELARQTRTISPTVFRYRVEYANLLARAAAAETGTENASRFVEEMAEALRIAGASPGLADFVPGVSRALAEGRVNLARRWFERGQFKEAKTQFENAAAMLKSSAGAGDASAAIDADVQVTRCDEAAYGDREAAMKRYRELLGAKPSVSCWVSTGVTVSGKSFLALKEAGELAEGKRAGTPAPADGRVTATAMPEALLYDRVHAFAASPGGLLRIEGDRRRHRVDVSTGKIVESAERPAPLGPAPSTMVPCGNGRAIFVHGETLSAVDLATGGILWTRGKSDQRPFGRLQTVKATAEVVIVGGSTGLQALSAREGQALWERKGEWMTFDLNDRFVAVLAPHDEEAKKLLALEPKTGRTVSTIMVSAAGLWLAPVLAGDLALMTDSFDGMVVGVDARTGRDLFTFELGAAPIAPLTVVGNVAFMHTTRDGVVRAAALDLELLRVRFDVPLKSKELAIDALGVAPIPWQERLLYLDNRTGSILSLDIAGGAVEAVAASGETKTNPSRSTFRWTLADDTLCLVGTGGEVRLRKLAVDK